MDLGEFEFELSDVDVAAFESVATEDPIQEQQQQQQQQQHQQQQQQQEQQHLQEQEQHQSIQLPPKQFPPSQDLDQSSTTPQQSQTTQQTIQQLTHVNQIPATSTPQGRILLVPINSKQGTTSYKQLYQLATGTSPIATLTTSGNKKQIIQLAPLSASNLNLSKSNHSFPIASANQFLPGSSQSFKQQQLYFTTNSSPLKQQQQQQQQQPALSLNSVLNKSIANLQNNTSISSQFSTSNLSTSRNVTYNDSLRAPTPNSNATNEVPKRKPCNCTKSQCLKLYCDCFANGEFCSGCNCTNCFNSLSKEKERQKAISQCLERNPEAFRPKIGKAVKSLGEPAPESIERRHTKGCNCKRSGCLKNYCECYEAKILCSNLCKCCGCKNYEESFERKSLMQLANSASENARGILKNLLPTNTNSNTGKEFTKCFITDKVIHASLVCLLQSAQQAEKDGACESNLPILIQTEMGKCLRMIVDSATETSSPKKR